MPIRPKATLAANADPKTLKSLGHFGSIGFEMAVFIVLGVKGGQWVDGYFDTKVFVLLGLALGLFAGFRSLFQLAAESRRAQQRDEADAECSP